MKRIAIGIAILLLAAVPLWVGGSFYVNIVSQVLIAAIFALGLDILVGYGGLISLGHAGLFGVAAYTVAVMLGAGFGHVAAIVAAIALTLAATAVFGVLALRTTGIGFIMITLALGQLLWGLAYRWIDLTHGDNGLSGNSRPAPFGISLDPTNHFYYATLIVFLLVIAAVALLTGSPFGASLRGTRDQPRRMAALGFDVWKIRFLACLFSGFCSGIAGILFFYYNEFISPHALALSASAEVLLMVIAGGSATLLGPIAGATLVVVMKSVMSAYIERWNFTLGAIFVLIVLFMPEGLVPGSRRLSRWLWATLKALRGGTATPAESQR
ncbi:MAG TPA: branched-chain amino acid ABC transporter permease [Stellaceae bacterium]|nr:branched-chain amino acid ABC transporter permease [Stellaceae bacterium]